MQIYPVHPIRQGILSTFLLLVLSVTAAWAQNSEILAPLERQVTEARAAQDMDEPQIAESRYRSARLEAWNLLGKIAVAGDDLQAAREAFEMSSVAATIRLCCTKAYRSHAVPKPTPRKLVSGW